MTNEAAVRDAFRFQAAYCDANGAPVTAGVCKALADGLDRTTETGRRTLGWTGHPIADALPLRLVAPFHALHRARRCAALDPVFGGHQADVGAAVRAALAAHDAEIVRWLDGPPQTNEPARSALFMAALLALALKFALPFELLEIGSSAGLNLLIDSYRYTLGGVDVGPPGASVQIAPRWKGPPPPAAAVRIASIRGVDIAPIDLSDAAATERLLAYVWIDQTERFTRTKAAIALWRAQPPNLDQGDAAGWIEGRLAELQASGTTRVLMHSIVWQYLPREGRARIAAAMEAAGVAATAERPLAWVRYEADRSLGLHELRVKTWPGGEDRHFANAHPHAVWVEWLGEEAA